MKRLLKNTRAGFTLIELLVVISIIGLLSSVVLVGVASARFKTQESFLIQQATQMMRIINIGLSDQNTSDYTPMYTGHWTGYVGDADCDFPPSWLSAALQENLRTACHKLYTSPIISAISADLTKPVLASVQQQYTGPPYQSSYTKDYGLSIKTTNGNLICVGGNGASNGSMDLKRVGASCYYSPPTLP